MDIWTLYSSLKSHPLLTRTTLKGEPVDVVIDKDRCIECESCREVCPLVKYVCFDSLDNEQARYLCIECHACTSVCPQDAVSVGGLGPGTLAGDLPSSDEMLNLIRARRSVRSFKPEKIRQEDWSRLLEAVKYSPTGHNAQYIDVTIVDSPEVLREFSAIGMGLVKTFSFLLTTPVLRLIFERMMGEHAYGVFSNTALFYEQQRATVEKGGDPILFHAPAVMLFHGPKHEKMSRDEADFAAQSVALFAPTLGLGTCHSGIIMVAFSGLSRTIAGLVGLPRGHKVFGALLVGYAEPRYRYVPHRKERSVRHI